jgi:hypothetical protein
MVVVFSVIFPKNLLFFPSFLISLENQTNKNFKLILFNDGVVNLDRYFKDSSLNIESYNVNNMSPFEIRLYGLEKVSEMGADYIIFADTDDLMTSERVASSVYYLKKYPFVCNDISIISKEGKLMVDLFWEQRITNKFEFGIKFIKNQNLIGLGNSAMQGNQLNKILNTLVGHSTGSDWLFFSAAENHLHAVFVTECCTLYRQHDNNIIGKKEINSASLFSMINKKIEHYNSLKRINFNSYAVDEQIELNQNILQMCKADPYFYDNQIKKINLLGINFFWWEESNYINLAQ